MPIDILEYERKTNAPGWLSRRMLEKSNIPTWNAQSKGAGSQDSADNGVPPITTDGKDTEIR
jgi:hypothetical protein